MSEEHPDSGDQALRQNRELVWIPEGGRVLSMAEIVASIKVENLPLYKDMAEFIVTLAQSEDKQVPAYVQKRAYDLACQIEAMRAKREQPAR